MKQKPFGFLGGFALAIVLVSGFATSTLGASQPAIYATSMFEREIDTPGSGPFGTAVLEESGDDQIFSVTINDLTGVANGGTGNFGVYTSTANNTSTPVFLIEPLNLLGTNNTWVLKYKSVGAAPPQLDVADLQDLSGLYLIIGNPGTTNITGGVTNIVGCVTNAFDDVTNVVGCVTNIVGGVTNYFVNTVLFTQIPEFTTKAGAPHFNRKAPLTTLSVPPNPIEKGYVKSIYTGSAGHSVFDILADHLEGGQSYSILIEFHIPSPASTIMSNIGPLVISTNSIHTGTYTRDTRRGETLPFNSPTVRDLSGRAIQIQDSFGEIHLEGTIP